MALGKSQQKCCQYSSEFHLQNAKKPDVSNLYTCGPMIFGVNLIQFRHNNFMMSSPRQQPHSTSENELRNHVSALINVLLCPVATFQNSRIQVNSFLRYEERPEGCQKFRHKLSSPRQCFTCQKTVDSLMLILFNFMFWHIQIMF